MRSTACRRQKAVSGCICVKKSIGCRREPDLRTPFRMYDGHLGFRADGPVQKAQMTVAGADWDCTADFTEEEPACGSGRTGAWDNTMKSFI